MRKEQSSPGTISQWEEGESRLDEVGTGAVERPYNVPAVSNAFRSKRAIKSLRPARSLLVKAPETSAGQIRLVAAHCHVFP